MQLTKILAVVASVTSVAAAQQKYLGFNYGATTVDSKGKTQADFEKEFSTAKELENAPGDFNTARLYTNVQAGTTDTPSEAFVAAIKTKTKLFLGIWCSGVTEIDNELNVLASAVETLGKPFTDLVIGISVGSEDMYRVSEPGIRNKAGVGNDADAIVRFIKDTREKLKNTDLRDIPIGHVDTWSAWTNESNQAVIDEVDFVGTNLFPYYESERQNSFDNATYLFESAINKTQAAVGEKEVWITETGWPYRGPEFGAAEATLENSKKYWDTVGCQIFGKRNVFWYTLQDNNPANEAKFGITEDYSTEARFDLTCPKKSDAPKTTKPGEEENDGGEQDGDQGGEQGGEQAGNENAGPEGNEDEPSAASTVAVFGLPLVFALTFAGVSWVV